MDHTATAAPTHLQLLSSAHAWLNDRIARVSADHLHRRTPCEAFDLETLLEHLATSVQRFTAALGGHAVEPSPTIVDPATLTGAYNALSTANLDAWATADMTATYRIPLGEIPAPVVANLNLAEVVLHGWDVGQATGERCDVPAVLADAVLAFGQAFLSDDLRGAAFGPALPCADGDASARMLAFYGRRG